MPRVNTEKRRRKELYDRRRRRRLVAQRIENIYNFGGDSGKKKTQIPRLEALVVLSSFLVLRPRTAPGWPSESYCACRLWQTSGSC